MKYFLTLLGVAALFIVVFAFKSCKENINLHLNSLENINFMETEKGNEDVVEEVRSVTDFSEITVSNAIELVLKQGDEQKIVVKTDSNLQDNIQTKNTDGVLTISSKGIINPTEIKVYVTFKDLTKIKASGATNVLGVEMKLNELELVTSGAAEVVLNNLTTNTLKIKETGASNIKIEGNSTDLNVRASGASDAKLYKFTTKNAKVVASGAANVKIAVAKRLDATASGAADISYKGNPEVINKNESGTGDVSKH